ncbi:DUF3054 domain-containing protein [Microbacterium foliorum]|uniref:DUF3054 domain-containing protein n=1 Tax=Microbacterium foliorum TaxID=104336 RepID=UPI00246808EA|nr:DUF3054 domain-containing protein [Microbacterium foliorum]
MDSCSRPGRSSSRCCSATSSPRCCLRDRGSRGRWRGARWPGPSRSSGGLLLRVVSGDTAQIAFIIVATLVLAVFLLGWRALAAFLRRRAGREEVAPADDSLHVDPAPGEDPVADAAAPSDLDDDRAR